MSEQIEEQKKLPQRSTKGTFLKGNTVRADSAVHKRHGAFYDPATEKSIPAFARTYSRAAIKLLGNSMLDKELNISVRLQCAKELLVVGVGKPSASKIDEHLKQDRLDEQGLSTMTDQELLDLIAS